MEQLLTTKLYIPQPRTELVRRPRLIEQLNAVAHRKLTLISAPAGFGKTTLVSEWVDDQANGDSATGIAWLSLDENDNDPARFLTYLIAALNRVAGLAAPIGHNALNMLQSPQPPPVEDVLIAVINDVAALAAHIMLVLDDYHVIHVPRIDHALAFLLDHLPAQLHLVIATRDDPRLPLARLRGRDQLTELRAVDLRFTSTEAAKFLNEIMNLDLSADDIAALESRTEGWIAGLQLAAISMRGHHDTARFIQSFSGSHRFVLDYLIEEVLEQQPAEVQTFLLQTAVLERLTGPLCDALTGQADGQTTLVTLEHANLFIIPLDEERCWYRYHHLFADLLRQRLHQMQPDWVFELHFRASQWYEQNGYVDEAIEHALRAEESERAAVLIERVAEHVWTRNEHSKLQQWLDRLPEELVFSKPLLCVFHAWTLFATGQQDAAERNLQAAEEIIGPDHNIQHAQLRGRIAVARAFLALFRATSRG